MWLAVGSTQPQEEAVASGAFGASGASGDAGILSNSPLNSAANSHHGYSSPPGEKEDPQPQVLVMLPALTAVPASPVLLAISALPVLLVDSS